MGSVETLQYFQYLFFMTTTDQCLAFWMPFLYVLLFPGPDSFYISPFAMCPSPFYAPWTHYIPYMVLLLADITWFPIYLLGAMRWQIFHPIHSMSIQRSIHFRWMDRQLYTLPHHQDSLFMSKSLRFHPELPWREIWINEKWKCKSAQWNHHRKLNNPTTSHLSSSQGWLACTRHCSDHSVDIGIWCV